MILEKYPSLGQEALIHVWPNIGFVSYGTDPNHPKQIIRFNKTGIAILSLCDGVHQIKSISLELAKRYQTSSEEVNAKVVDFLEQMEQVLPLSFEDQPRRNNLHVTGSTEYITPMHAAIELSYKCNLQCRHCYVNSISDSKKQLSRDQVFQIFEKLYGWGVRVIELTGGEPTIHPDFLEILQIALERFDLVAILTNGTHVTDEFLNTFVKFPKKVVVQVDLDGATPEYVDWFRGQPGTFRKEIDAIRKLCQQGVRLRLAMCVTPGNLCQMEQTVNLARSLGVPTIGIATVIPMGRGNDPSLLLSVAETQMFLKLWADLQERYPNLIFHLEDLAMQKAKGNCGAGTRSVTITPLGQVKLCQMSDIDVLCYGNIFAATNAGELFNLPVISYIEQLEPPTLEICGDCPNLSFCYQCISRGISKGREVGVDSCKWYALHHHHLSKGAKI